MSTRPVKMGDYRWYPLLVLFIVLIIASVFNVIYTNEVDQRRAEAERKARIEADRRWCKLMTELDTAYQSTPASTDLGRRVAQAVHDLRMTLECE